MAGLASAIGFVLASRWRHHRGSTELPVCCKNPPGDQSDPMKQPAIPMRNPAIAAFLAWLIPGLGHYYQGRKGKAILYAVCILSLWALVTIRVMSADSYV